MKLNEIEVIPGPNLLLEVREKETANLERVYKIMLSKARERKDKALSKVAYDWWSEIDIISAQTYDIKRWAVDMERAKAMVEHLESETARLQASIDGLTVTVRENEKTIRENFGIQLGDHYVG